MNIETVSYLKKNAANINLDEPMLITQNGHPVYVITSYDEYHNTQKVLREVIETLSEPCK